MTSSGLTDFTYLRDFCGNDEAFIDEMKALFVQNTPNDLESIEKSIAEKDHHGAYRLVHSLKSSVNFMGISSIKTDILTLEKCLKTETDLEKVPALFEKVNSTCSQAVKELS